MFSLTSIIVSDNLNTMIVYRIEDRFGQGPYRWDSYNFDQYQKADLVEMMDCHLDSKHPNPREDGIKGDPVFRKYDHGEFLNSAYYCGFESIEALSEWFSSFEPILAAAGFKVSEYEIDENAENAVFFGSRQVVFKKSLARLDAVNNITDLLVCTICGEIWCGIHGADSSPYGIYPLRQTA